MLRQDSRWSSLSSLKRQRDERTRRFRQEGRAEHWRAPKKAIAKNAATKALVQPGGQRRLPKSVDEDTIARLAVEAEVGIPVEKLRRRGRPAIGDDAASTYSVRLPVDLATLADERYAIDGVSRGETIRRALVEYLTA